ncbi:helix-turn-helix domain-containing protein [Robbsia andropogonis]|uniref:helix-turn-helix domain-containing protein n=1 Tax=Robbsia andropogonis TaxID=28092 RepID=UPI002A6B0632|nr:helix-turn-helix domain-containing protein [Robbsia andropogonis]
MGRPAKDREKASGQVGRPSQYKPEFAAQAEKLCKLGATDKEMADFFGVTEQTVNNWKNDFPEFFESIKKGKILADAEVADRLYQRAIGYNHPASKFFMFQGTVIEREYVEHYPPDTAAAFIWLKNRQRDKWREKQPDELKDDRTIIVLNGGVPDAKD